MATQFIKGTSDPKEEFKKVMKSHDKKMNFDEHRWRLKPRRMFRRFINKVFGVK